MSLTSACSDTRERARLKRGVSLTYRNMFSHIDWRGLAVIAAVIAGLGFAVTSIPDGWLKSTLRVAFFALVLVVGAVLLWNLAAHMRHER